jgi:hypothetical protein
MERECRNSAIRQKAAVGACVKRTLRSGTGDLGDTVLKPKSFSDGHLFVSKGMEDRFDIEFAEILLGKPPPSPNCSMRDVHGFGSLCTRARIWLIVYVCAYLVDCVRVCVFG